MCHGVLRQEDTHLQSVFYKGQDFFDNTVTCIFSLIIGSLHTYLKGPLKTKFLTNSAQFLKIQGKLEVSLLMMFFSTPIPRNRPCFSPRCLGRVLARTSSVEMPA